MTVHMDDTAAPPASGVLGLFPYLNPQGAHLGWQIKIRRRGILFHRSFNARDHGGMDGALQAALALRDEIDRHYPVMSKREWSVTLRSTNTSGVPGVLRVQDRTGEHWKARVHLPDGRVRTRQFSIAKYGDEAAYQLAVAARRKLLALLEGMAPGYAPRDDAPPVADFDAVLRAPARLTPEPNPFAPAPACEVIGVHLTHVKDKRPGPDGRYALTPYWTAVIEREHGAPLRRYFSVLRYGDETARRLAIEQRQAWEAQQARGEPYTVQRGGASGIKGVLRHHGVWLARLHLSDGRVKTRSFAIGKHGEEGARQRAIEARRQMVELYGGDDA